MLKEGTVQVVIFHSLQSPHDYELVGEMTTLLK